MNILVLGGTRYFGVHLVKELLKMGHHVTIATRGITSDCFGEMVERIFVDRYDINQMKSTFQDKEFDVVYDNLAYSSNDVKTALETICCKRYILTSSGAVYPHQMNTTEDAFVALNHNLKWGNRKDFSYDEGKRQAESVVAQIYKDQKTTAVRFPVVLGADDYSRRLYYYVEHIAQQKPMDIDNASASFSFISSTEAGAFLAFLSDKNINEPINAGSAEPVTLREILTYIEEKTGKKAILKSCDDKAPFNGMQSHSLSVEKAVQNGFTFTALSDWLYPLLDEYISQCKNI